MDLGFFCDYFLYVCICRPNYNEILRGISNFNPDWAQSFALKLYHYKDAGEKAFDVGEFMVLLNLSDYFSFSFFFYFCVSGSFV
jgi:hypothetical protein